MTFFLKKRTPEEQAQVDDILTRPIPSIGERIQAQATETRILKNFNDRKQKTEADLIEEVIGQIPPEYITAKTPENSSGAAGRYDYVFDGVRKAQAANPDLKLPTSIEEFDAQVDMRRRAELDEARDVLDLADGFVPELVGDVMAEVTNPESIPYLMMGAGAGWRLGATMAAEGVAAGLDEARTIGTQYQVAEDLGIEGPNAGMQVGVAALTGAGVAGALVGGGKALSYGIERFNTTGARRPAGARQLDFAQDVEAAETALRSGQPPQRQNLPRPAAPSAAPATSFGARFGFGKTPEQPSSAISGLSPAPAPGDAKPAPSFAARFGFGKTIEEPVRPAAPTAASRSANNPDWTFKVQPQPQNWPAIKNGIFVGESGGDYNALFGYQNRRGGRYENIKLTEMTVDQAIEFSNVNGEYGQWVKGELGRIGQRARVATPMGAYQIVGTTLRAAKKGLGLRGDEVMDEALQDQLGIWIYRQQGTGAWEGYRGPRANGPGAVDPNAAAPRVAGSGGTDADGFVTTRQYTRDGQITAGDDFRIDVAYEVVDLPTLTRASGDLQPRDRARKSSDEQVNEIAAGLDPARLMPSPEADRGAPIVGPDNIIESGNGRVMGIERAYQRYPDRADAYRAQIEAAGFAVPEGMTQPVLVARRTSELTPEKRSDFVRKANVSSTARMSATERAAIDARAIDSETVAMFDPAQPLASKGNVPFTQRFLNKLPQTERNALVDGTGALNAEGVTRVRQALFARAFDAPDILARYAEADAGELRSLMDALEASAPAWAGMRNAISEGRVRADLDVTPFVLEAMRLIADARRIATRENKASAAMVEELMADVDLLEGATAPLTAALVRMFYPAGRAAPAAKVTAFLDRFAAEAQKVGRTDASLFDDAVSDLDVLKAIDADAFGKLTETGKARIPDNRAPQPRDVPSDAMPANAFADGAASPEIQEAADELAETLRAQDAADAQAIRDLVAEFEGGDGIEVKLDGETMTSRQILEDLDQDEALQTVIDACTVKGAA